MKRTALTRKTPLARAPFARSRPVRPDRRECEECGRDFQPVWTGLAWSVFCSVSCVVAQRPPLTAGDVAVAPRRRDPKRRTKDEDRRWKMGAPLGCEIPGCVFCARERTHATLHHVVYQQRLRSLKADEWDPRNRLVVCDHAHQAHHRRRSVILAIHLPDSAYVFAREVMGAGAAHEYLSRRYDGDDPRLAALDAEWRLADDTTAH